MNWTIVYNRLFEIINPADKTDPCYFSGPRFLNKVREVDPYFSNYDQYIGERRDNEKSTSPKISEYG